MKFALPVLIMSVLALFGASVASAAAVSLTIAESYDGLGNETASAAWSSDPAAVISVTRDFGAPGEVWLIDLTASGHQVPGAAWPNGFTIATWEEPEHPGQWNNLYIIDSQHMRLESEWPTATGQNMGNYPSGFGNGVSYYAGSDFNGDSIFVRVVESPASVPTEATTWGNIKAQY